MAATVNSRLKVYLKPTVSKLDHETVHATGTGMTRRQVDELLSTPVPGVGVHYDDGCTVPCCDPSAQMEQDVAGAVKPLEATLAARWRPHLPLGQGRLDGDANACSTSCPSACCESWPRCSHDKRHEPCG